MERIGGYVSVQVDGVTQRAKGTFTWSLGHPKRAMVKGSDNKTHGYTETPQVGYIEGKITDSASLSVEALLDVTNSTVTLEAANGKIYAWRNACYAGDGNIESENGEIDFRFEGDGEEIA